METEQSSLLASHSQNLKYPRFSSFIPQAPKRGHQILESLLAFGALDLDAAMPHQLPLAPEVFALENLAE
tara:strand:- start:1 stop:210 length:210 start_codon:yes stop_codon:yes gene_type:complete